MTETVKDNKQKRQEEFMKEHTLTEQDFRKMILEKTARARAYSMAAKQREKLFEKFR